MHIMTIRLTKSKGLNRYECHSKKCPRINYTFEYRRVNTLAAANLRRSEAPPESLSVFPLPPSPACARAAAPQLNLMN